MAFWRIPSRVWPRQSSTVVAVWTRRSGPAWYDLSAFNQVRLDVGRFLALGLEFQLASDLLRTAVAPSFEEIGKLAAVAAIRTALNFFLRREIREERDEIKAAEVKRGERSAT